MALKNLDELDEYGRAWILRQTNMNERAKQRWINIRLKLRRKAQRIARGEARLQKRIEETDKRLRERVQSETKGETTVADRNNGQTLDHTPNAPEGSAVSDSIWSRWQDLYQRSADALKEVQANPELCARIPEYAQPWGPWELFEMLRHLYDFRLWWDRYQESCYVHKANAVIEASQPSAPVRPAAIPPTDAAAQTRLDIKRRELEVKEQAIALQRAKMEQRAQLRAAKLPTSGSADIGVRLDRIEKILRAIADALDVDCS